MSFFANASAIVFFLCLAITYGVAIFARLQAKPGQEEHLAGRQLNKWLVGLSAGTTGNSGFIVTAAVALGYVGGVHWLLLPVSWMLGDLLYWAIFPQRINALARQGRSVTLSELLTFDLHGLAAKLIIIITSLLLVTFLSGYTAAQWLAGKKFLSGAFGLTEDFALLLFAISIIGYSSLGGFRGSVYADVIQSIVRLAGTVIALVAVIWYAAIDLNEFTKNIASAGGAFLNLFPGDIIASIGFIFGFAMAAVGFGLGQPQIVSRYMAGRSPEETRAAWWIYIGFVQFTWIAMTAFGVVLRGVMPGITDPETGLSLFFLRNMGAVVTGVIFADVFATIASTSNGILVSITQIFQRDLFRDALRRTWLSPFVTLILGLGTIGLSLILPGNVFSIAIDSVSQIGAGIAGPMMIKALRVSHTGYSLLMSIIGGICAAFIWKYMGYDAFMNEAAVGIFTSLLVNLFIIRLDNFFGSRIKTEISE